MEDGMDIEISVAVSKNGFMDIEGVRYSGEDKRRLRERIKDMAVVISRGSYEEALRFRDGRPFDCKETVVISSKNNCEFPECKIVHSLLEGLEILKAERKIMLFGGKDLYEEALGLPETSIIYLTEIDVEYDGRVRFPPIDGSYWNLSSTERHKGSPAVTFKTFRRSCPLCLSHPRKFFGKPVKEEVFWDFYSHHGRYVAVYKKGHTPKILCKEASQELEDFIMWLRFEHKEGWKDPERALQFDHAHVFFGWRAVVPETIAA